MVNWIFSYVDKRLILEGMFVNIGVYLKLGGIFVGIRDVNFFSYEFKRGKYGVYMGWVKEIEGGVKYWVVLYCKFELVEFEVVLFEIIYGGLKELYENVGLIKIVEMLLESV